MWGMIYRLAIWLKNMGERSGIRFIAKIGYRIRDRMLGL